MCFDYPEMPRGKEDLEFKILGKRRKCVFLTRRVQSVDAKDCLAMKHPEVAVIAGQQARFAGRNHVITNNVTTRKTSDRMSNTNA